MPRPNYWIYEKKAPFKDATLFIIICEGEKREPSYFQFFDGLTSRIKVVPIPSEDGKSAPKHLIANAYKIIDDVQMQEDDQLWFVLDTDKWRDTIHDLRDAANANENWHVAQSNPSFEVWLYYHFKNGYPESDLKWKNVINDIINGGFDCTKHPCLIRIAHKNCKENYKAEGYLPLQGSSQVYLLAEEIIPLVCNELDKMLEG